MKHRSPTNDDAPPEQSIDWPPDNFDDPDELIAAAHQYFATDFPNPERRGCSAPGAYQSLASAGRTLNAESRAHLFGCSECFNEYRAAALERRHQTASKKFARANAWMARMNIALHASRVPFAVGAIALLLLVAGLFVWRHRQTTTSQSGQSSPWPVSATPAIAMSGKPEADRGSPAPPAPKSQTPAGEELLAVNVDLNEFRPHGAQSRSSANKEEEPIKLPAARLRLMLVLREQSAEGDHRIRIIDATGRSLAVVRSYRRDGRRLSVTLDLRQLASQKVTLRIERANQPDVAPEEYEIELIQP